MAIVAPIVSTFASKGVDEAKKGFEKLGKGIGDMAKAAGAALAGIGIAAAGVAAKAAADFVGFERQMNEVFTLLPGITDDAMKDMSNSVKDFAKEFGVLPQDIVPALYQSLSAGVPPDNVFAFLETAQKAAKGGVTDLTTAVDGISSVVNAYGADVIDAAKASDLMFTAVRLGKTDFSQLSSSLFQVTPIASALGVGFEDITASLAVLTAQGVPTSVAATQMKAAMSELGKQGTKADKAFQKITGESFPDFIANGGNVYDAFMAMSGGAEDAGISVLDMFGSIEAGQAVLALSAGDGEAFASAMKEMGASAGATDAAFDQMMKGLGPMIDQLKAEFAVIMLEIGERVVPLVIRGIEIMRGLVNRLTPVFQKFANAFKTDGLGGIIATAESFLPKIQEKLGQFGQALIDWIGPRIGPMLEALGNVLAALGGWLIDTGLPFLGEKLAQLGKALYEWIEPRVGPALRELGALIGKLANWVIDTGLPLLVSKLIELGDALVNWIKPRIGPALQFLGEFLTALAGWVLTVALPRLVTEAAKLGRAIIGWIADILPDLVIELGKFLAKMAWWVVTKGLPGVLGLGLDIGKELIHGIGVAIGGLVSALFNIGKRIVLGIIDGITSMAGAVGSAIAGIIPGGSAVSGFLGGNVLGGLKKITPFAKGGLVTSPTLGLVGEAGPEVVVPLDRLDRMGGVTINVNGALDPVAVARQIREILNDSGSRLGVAAL
jgi:TP901 family phage tail tape measure protein